MDEQKTEPPKKFYIPHITLGLGLSTFTGWGIFDPETFKSFVSAAWREEMIKMMIAFTVAGIVHRFIFRKDMEKYFMKIVNPIVDALNNIADKTTQTEGKISEMNTKIINQGDRLKLVEQHLTERTT